ncbi:MAG: hypothetical protein ABI367_01350 [Mucilaginibacter sp.]
MASRPLFISIVLLWILSGCGMMQSIVKSTLPYTTTLTIPASSGVGVAQSATNIATSFDQNFSITGNNGQHISEVSVISAKLEASDPADYNIGNLRMVKIYVSKNDGKDEVLVASNTNIAATAGNYLMLKVDNTRFLDQLVRQPDIRIRMAYQLRQKPDADVNVHLVMNINAYPAGR